MELPNGRVGLSAGKLTMLFVVIVRLPYTGSDPEFARPPDPFQ